MEVKRIDSEVLQSAGAKSMLADVDGILVPGGFGSRGIPGKIEAIRYARENKVPFLGLCLGMQCAVIEYARNVCGLEDAHSTEFAPDTPHPILDLLPEQEGVCDKGGTMRLGAEEVRLRENTLALRAYGESVIRERHRHRFEFNNAYREILSGKGIVFSGTTTRRHLEKDIELVEIVELPGHPYFIASQFHPEFKSRPTRAHPLFREFIRAALATRSG